MGLGVIITGCPGSGKSTLLNALSNTGWQFFPEFARVVIKEQLQVNSRQVPWDDVMGFSLLVLDKMKAIKAEVKQSDHLVLLDRGIPDILAYCKKANLPDDTIFQSELHSYPYHKVAFILPPWKEIYCSDGIRKENFEEACLIDSYLREIYAKLGFELIEIPKDTVENRLVYIQTVLNNLNHTQGVVTPV